MRQTKRHRNLATPSPLPLFDWFGREFCDTYARARALDREADAALFYGRATAAERLSNQAAELRDAAQ